MRVKLLLILLPLYFLYAQESASQNQTFKQALEYFNIQQYDSAYVVFNTLTHNNLNNKKLNFYLGRSAYEIKKYNQAYAAYQRILINDEQNHRVRLEMARVLYDMKLYGEALVEFERVLIHPIPDVVRKRIEFMMSQIKELKKGYKLSKTILFAIGNSDNINSNTHEAFTTYGSINLENDTNQIEDTYHKFIVALNFLYPFKNTTYTFENSTLFYMQSFIKNHSSDIALISLSNGISYNQKRYKLSFDLLTDKIWYGSNELYTTLGVSNSLSYILDKTLVLKSKIKYTNKSMSQSTESNKDANSYYINLQLIKALPNNSSIKLKSYYKEEEKIRGTRIDVNKDMYGISISYQKALITSLSTTLSYSYDENKYKDDDPILVTRNDKSDTYTLGFIKQINKQNSISLIGTYINNKSNVELNSYKKNTIEILYTKSF